MPKPSCGIVVPSLRLSGGIICFTFRLPDCPDLIVYPKRRSLDDHEVSARGFALAAGWASRSAVCTTYRIEVQDSKSVRASAARATSLDMIPVAGDDLTLWLASKSRAVRASSASKADRAASPSSALSI